MSDTDEDDSSISSSDEEDSDNDVEGANVAAKSDEDATDEKDQGNEAVKDTNTDLDGRKRLKLMTDVESLILKAGDDQEPSDLWNRPGGLKERRLLKPQAEKLDWINPVRSPISDDLATALHLQLGVEEYQKKLNLTKPDITRSDPNLKRTSRLYSILRSSRIHLCENKDKKNRLMRIAKILHVQRVKFNHNGVGNLLESTFKRVLGRKMDQGCGGNPVQEGISSLIESSDHTK
ncbi:hypothetical protein Tco_0209409 [Tanacetum coccineum]